MLPTLLPCMQLCRTPPSPLHLLLKTHFERCNATQIFPVRQQNRFSSCGTLIYDHCHSQHRDSALQQSIAPCWQEQSTAFHKGLLEASQHRADLRCSTCFHSQQYSLLINQSGKATQTLISSSTLSVLLQKHRTACMLPSFQIQQCPQEPTEEHYLTSKEHRSRDSKPLRIPQF